MKARALLSAVVLGSTLSLGLEPAFAHGFGERYDLPAPLSYFAVGAGAAVALSFVIIGLFVQRGSSGSSYPVFNLLSVRFLGTFIASNMVLNGMRIVSVFIFILVVATGLFGTERSIDNFSPVFVWIIWWVGMGYVAALIGNAWMLVNPWRIAFEWAEAFMGSWSGHTARPVFTYPKRLDRWPAVILFLCFAWLENVYPGAAQPFKLGILLVVYSAITWAGMLLFGKHEWLRNGEAFSVLFGFFARFSPTEVCAEKGYTCESCPLGCAPSAGKCVDCYNCFELAGQNERRLNLRPYAVGLARPDVVSTATAVFVVVALTVVAFDGLKATPGWVDFQTAVYPFADSSGLNPVKVIDTVGLLLLPVVFLAVYLAFCCCIRYLSADRSTTQDVAKAFVFSLVPIALAYNMAHFISLLVIQGQLIIPLASDPFGQGWDLFGSAEYGINITAINAKFVWFLSVIAIVLGHIASVYIAHVISLGRAKDRSSALRGQCPMLVLMVGYTITSLWIIAQPIVEG